MPFLRNRSYQKELLDGNDIPFEDIKRNMQELDFINRKLGGHKITIDGIRQLIGSSKIAQVKIVEIGSGGGDNLRAIKNWANKKKLKVELIGIDINPECVVYAREQNANEGIRFKQSDYKNVSFDEKPHIIFSSLFCHHFTEQELIDMLNWMKRNSEIGFFINDLHRHSLAYYSIKILTSLFSKSLLVKNDAPLSVRRGFKRKEWNNLFSSAGILNFKCSWRWAFRWLITYAHADQRTI